MQARPVEIDPATDPLYQRNPPRVYCGGKGTCEYLNHRGCLVCGRCCSYWRAYGVLDGLVHFGCVPGTVMVEEFIGPRPRL